MTDTGFALTGEGDPGRTPSAELVHVPGRLKARPNAGAPRYLPVMVSSPGHLSPRMTHQADPLAVKVRSLHLLTASAGDAPARAQRVVCYRQTLNNYVALYRSATTARVRERARLAVFAALNARRAILESPTQDGWKATVAEFTQTWLGIAKPGERWLEAASTALLGDWVDLLDKHCLDDVGEPGLQLLKLETATVHEQLQPLWRRKSGGARLLSLDHPVTGGGKLIDLLADKAAPLVPSHEWEPDNDQAAIVFGQLSPREQEIARAWACFDHSSWMEAAEFAGFTDPQAEAERVRRKLRRLGRRQQERQAAVITCPGDLVGGNPARRWV
ncbi:hypothetical protein [Streptomyces sp. 039-1]|uniref:hypothetical protein n=1 Tax=Streptomyces sp. 039-1 TaxID=2789263 RepID=UPI0039F5CB64